VTRARLDAVEREKTRPVSAALRRVRPHRQGASGADRVLMRDHARPPAALLHCTTCIV
jgi:hypothetical protein